MSHSFGFHILSGSSENKKAPLPKIIPVKDKAPSINVKKSITTPASQSVQRGFGISPLLQNVVPVQDKSIFNMVRSMYWFKEVVALRLVQGVANLIAAKGLD